MASNSREEAIERVKKSVIAVRGVIGVAELTAEQRQEVGQLELGAMKNVLGGMGRGKNVGITEVLTKQVVLVFFVNMLFETPKDASLMILMCDGLISGWASTDMDLIERYKKDKDYIVLSDFFIIRRGAKLSQNAFASGNSCFLFNGTQLEEFFRIPEIKEHVVAIPSPPGFQYLYELFRSSIDLSDPRIGGFLLGFNWKSE